MSHIHLLIFDYLLLVNLDECQTPTQYELSKKCAKLNHRRLGQRFLCLLSLSAILLTERK